MITAAPPITDKVRAKRRFRCLVAAAMALAGMGALYYLLT
jgi:hypothetical protein